MKLFNPSKLIKPARVYIVPNRNGLTFLAMLIVMILVGAGFQNNLIYLLGFVLFALFFITMIHTNQNLSGLEVKSISAQDSFSGDKAWVTVQFFNRRSSPRFNLVVEANDKDLRSAFQTKVGELSAYSSQTVTFPVEGLSRGRHVMPRIRLSTTHPLGLLYSWMMLQPTQELFVYPHPKGERAFSRRYLDDSQEGMTNAYGGVGVDFREHKKYEPGDPPSRIDWKLYARREQLHTRVTEAEVDQAASFSFGELEDLNIEDRLSQLSNWCQQAWDNKWIFELRLPEKNIGLGSGFEHYQKCLRALASFESKEVS